MISICFRISIENFRGGRVKRSPFFVFRSGHRATQGRREGVTKRYTLPAPTMEREEALGLPPFWYLPSWGSSPGASPSRVTFFKRGSLIPRKVQKLPGASPFGTASRGGKIVYLRNMIFCISDILIRCNYAIIILYNSGIIIGKNFPLTEWDGSQT